MLAPFTKLASWRPLLTSLRQPMCFRADVTRHVPIFKGEGQGGDTAKPCNGTRGKADGLRPPASSIYSHLWPPIRPPVRPAGQGRLAVTSSDQEKKENP